MSARTIHEKEDSSFSLHEAYFFTAFISNNFNSLTFILQILKLFSSYTSTILPIGLSDKIKISFSAKLTPNRQVSLNINEICFRNDTRKM